VVCGLIYLRVRAPLFTNITIVVMNRKKE
jgi:hypothetical protein